MDESHADVAAVNDDDGEYDARENEEEDVRLYGRKSPISRISRGGSVYPEPADSPQSFASLDDSDIGVKTPGWSELRSFVRGFFFVGSFRQEFSRFV